MNSVSVESSLNKGRFVKVLKLMGLTAAVVSGSVFSQGVLAECRRSAGPSTGDNHVTWSSDEVVIDSTVPNDTVLGVLTGPITLSQATCTPGAVTIRVESEHTHQGSGLYDTGVLGVSMRLKLGAAAQGTMSEVTSPGEGTGVTNGSGFLTYHGSLATIEFVKTGNIPSSGSLQTNRLLMISKVKDIQPLEATILTLRLASPIAFKVLRPTCTVGTPNQNVQLDPASTADFDATTGRAKSKDFNIDLTCMGAGMTDVSVTLTDATNPGQTGGATLTPASGSDAEGVAFEIHKGSGSNNPVQFGELWRALPDTRAGSYSIPLSVNYLKTGGLISGTVKAAMTYTLDYQ